MLIAQSVRFVNMSDFLSVCRTSTKCFKNQIKAGQASYVNLTDPNTSAVVENHWMRWPGRILLFPARRLSSSKLCLWQRECGSASLKGSMPAGPGGAGRPVLLPPAALAEALGLLMPSADGSEEERPLAGCSPLAQQSHFQAHPTETGKGEAESEPLSLVIDHPDSSVRGGLICERYMSWETA